MQKYYSIVTDIGEELLAKAVQENKKLNIVSLAAGDGNGTFYKPTSDMTALKKECWRGSIKSYEIDSISRNVIKVSGVVPSDVGRFVLRELALFDDNDNMIAVANLSAPGVNLVDAQVTLTVEGVKEGDAISAYKCVKGDWVAVDVVAVANEKVTIKFDSKGIFTLIK